MEICSFYQTRISGINICSLDNAITSIKFVKPQESITNLESCSLNDEAFSQIKEYLEGKRKNFNLPLNPQGTTFQKKIWKALQKIPYGEVRSYKDIAVDIGNPKAARAVGMANNRNPIPIIIPCHRVIGSNGKLVGYASGTKIKKILLALENNL